MNEETVEELSGKAERIVEEGERLPSPKERDKELENDARRVQQPIAAFQRTIVLIGESLDRLAGQDLERRLRGNDIDADSRGFCG